MKIIVTGFSGFVAYHFLNYLNSVCSNANVLGLDKIKPVDFDRWHFENLNISFASCNLCNANEIESKVLEFNPDYILHLAAMSSVGQSWKDPAGCFVNNTGIFLNIAESVRKYCPACKILCVGSSEEYGTVNKEDLPLRESMSLNPENPYAVTKMSQEAMSKCYVTGYKMKICMTRSFNHIGPRQRDTFVIASFVKQFAQASLLEQRELRLSTGNLNVERDFLDVRDVVKAYYLILNSGKPGELYNVCSGNGYKLSDIIKTLSKISGISVSTKTDPSLVRPNDIPIIYGSYEKLNKDTGWKPSYEMEQSLSDIYNYWKEILSK